MWLIGEVTYRLAATGTHADLMLMPPAAYSPEPEMLAPFFFQIARELPGGGAMLPPSTNAQTLQNSQATGVTVNPVSPRDP